MLPAERNGLFILPVAPVDHDTGRDTELFRHPCCKTEIVQPKRRRLGDQNTVVSPLEGLDHRAGDAGGGVVEDEGVPLRKHLRRPDDRRRQHLSLV